MSSNEQVPVHVDGSPAQKPVFFAPREECRAMKKAGKGYFIDHGRKFVLVREALTEPDWEALQKAYDFRGQSLNPDERIMFHYVNGLASAVAIINAWRFDAAL